MQISFVMSSLRLSGGVSLVVEYANRLASRGHQVSLVTPASTTDPEIRARVGAAIRICETPRGLPALNNPIALMRLSVQMALATPTSDVLVATHTPTVAPVLLAARRGQGRPVWLYMDYPEMFRHRPIERWLLDQAPGWFTSIATISTPLRNYVAKRTKSRVIVTGSGLRRPDIFRAQLPRQRHTQPYRLMYVGDDRPRKGLREAVHAAELVAQSVPSLTLIIVAKQPCVIQTRLPIEFHLRPSDEQLADLYRSADVFISASWGEGLGYPPLEAMACGIPIVMTDSDGVRDYARAGENCLLVPPRDSHALAQASLRLLQDDELAQRLIWNGLQTANRYEWETAVDRFEVFIAASVP